MEKLPKVAIVYLSYHSEPYLDDLVSSLKRLDYPKDKLAVIIVDNPHPTHGSSVRSIEETVTPYSESEIPKVVVLAQEKNLGFAGGNNVGAKWAVDNSFDYVFFHNNDGFMAPDCIKFLVRAMESDSRIGIAQSLILLHPETDLVNTAGNVFQYLGFGYCDEYKTKVSELHLPLVKDINYASGAAMMVKVSDIKDSGAWDEDFFLYHEDMEWSFRLRSVGKRIVLVRDSIFYHKYQFARSIEKFYFMERNRIGVMIMFFRLGTLLLLLPVALVLEIGLWLFAWRGGYLDKHISVYKYWTKKENWQLWWAKRKRVQARRTVSDRYLLSFSRPGIHFQEKSISSPLLKYIGNPILTVYYWLVVKLFIPLLVFCFRLIGAILRHW